MNDFSMELLLVEESGDRAAAWHWLELTLMILTLE